MPARKRTPKYRLTTPKPDVTEKQDPEHTEAEFLRDLERASTDRAGEALKRERPGNPSGPTSH